MNQISPQNYFRTSLAPHFPEPTVNSDLAVWCKHLPWAILTGHKKASSLIDSCKLRTQYTKLKKIGLMHLAALSDNGDLIRKLCENSKEKFPQDKEGNSPLHFRAMVSQAADFKNDPFYQNYISSCKVSTKQIKKLNAFGATAGKLHTLANSVLNAQKNPSHPVDTGNSHSKMVKMSPSVTFEEQCLLGFKYTPKMVTTSQALIDQWLHFPYEGSKKYTKNPLYSAFLKDQPQLVVRQSQTGCGVFAQNDIPARTIASDFNGEYIADKLISENIAQPVSDYFLSHKNTATHRTGTEPLVYRGEGAMINDGPPNLIAISLYNQKGIGQQATFISLGIEAGEELFFDYGATQNIKYLDYQLTHLDRLRKVLAQKKYPLEDFPTYHKKWIFENMKPHNGYIDETFANSNLEHTNAMVTFQYLFSTPRALFKMITEGAIKAADLKKIIFTIFQAKESLPLTTQPFFIVNTLMGYLLASYREKMINRGEKETFEKIMQGIDKHYARFMTPYAAEHEKLGKLIFTDCHIRYFNMLNRMATSADSRYTELIVDSYTTLDIHEGKTDEELQLLASTLHEQVEKDTQALVAAIFRGLL